MSRSRLFVGNIPFNASESDLRQFFSAYTLRSVNIVTDRETGRARGFAFVDLDESISTQDVIQALDRQQLGGRAVMVSEAKERPARAARG